MIALAKHSYITDRLSTVSGLSGMLDVHQKMIGPIPKGPTNFESLEKIIQAITDTLGQRFPVHVDYPYNLMPEDVYYVRLDDIICMQGHDVDWPFEELSPLEQLAWALTLGGKNSPWSYSGHDDLAVAWWENHRTGTDRPPLEDLDCDEIKFRLAGLPEPYIGLWAAWRFILGETGFLFADVPCSYSHELGLGLEWDMENIEMLTLDYQAADRQIFSPSWTLKEMLHKDPDLMGFLIDLALGRVNAEIRDGELIVKDLSYVRQ